jgi:hypothetical protein
MAEHDAQAFELKAIVMRYAIHWMGAVRHRVRQGVSHRHFD